MKFTTRRAVGALVFSILVVSVLEGIFGPDDGLSSASIVFASVVAVAIGYWVSRSRRPGESYDDETN